MLEDRYPHGDDALSRCRASAQEAQRRGSNKAQVTRTAKPKTRQKVTCPWPAGWEGHGRRDGKKNSGNKRKSKPGSCFQSSCLNKEEMSPS